MREEKGRREEEIKINRRKKYMLCVDKGNKSENIGNRDWRKKMKLKERNEESMLACFLCDD